MAWFLFQKDVSNTQNRTPTLGKIFLLITHSFKNRQHQFKAAIVDETRDNILFELYELVRVFEL